MDQIKGPSRIECRFCCYLSPSDSALSRQDLLLLVVVLLLVLLLVQQYQQYYWSQQSQMNDSLRTTDTCDSSIQQLTQPSQMNLLSRKYLDKRFNLSCQTESDSEVNLLFSKYPKIVFIQPISINDKNTQKSTRTQKQNLTQSNSTFGI